MKIALTITELHPGGAEKCLVQLAQYLQARGHHVVVWQLWPAPPQDRRSLTDQLDSSGIAWHSGNASRASEFPSTCRWLGQQLQQFQPDLVQSFLFHANLATAWALANSKVPLFGGARVRQPEKVRQWLQRIASKRMHKLICVSHAVAEHCRRTERISPEKLLVIPNGIDLSTISSLPTADWQKLGLAKGAKVILYVGRLTAQKGVLDLVSSAHLWLNELPEHHLVLMGAGEQRAALQQAIDSSSCSDRIRLVGWQRDAQAWMQAASCLILAARYEGMPNAVLEAMAVATPVVCFEVDGIRELLGNETLSEPQIAMPGCFEELARKIHTLASNEHLRQRCGKFNRHRVRDHFQLQDQLAKYERLYLDTLSKESSDAADPGDG